jgi:DNA-binding response OmpR family regulator
MLVVDDEPAMGRLIRRVGERCGYEVRVTTCSETFMDEVVRAEPDVIVLDLSLPGADGVDLLRFLATSRSRAKILIVSGFDSRVLETTSRLGSARGLRIAGTVAKPARVADIEAAFLSLSEDAL